MPLPGAPSGFTAGEPVTGDGKAGRLRVEVVYALRQEQALVALEMEDGTSAREAIERSGLLQRYPEIRLAKIALGIFGHPVSPDRLLRDGDRVEIYRPLLADPKQARRERAERRKKKKGGS
jgi:putative ubiquitin-RnfH superfamily antitoxin RatB of RatAB toxin-antitoxin module